MVTTMKSFTNDAQYKLTICADRGVAIDCTCPDMQHRGKYNNHCCKHQKAFNEEVQRAATFILLQRQVREQEENARSARALIWETSY